MDASKKQREPVAFKSLAELKRFIRPGVELKTVSHANHADMVGLTRVVTTVQTVGFYSKIKDQPEHPFSTCNHGKGFYTDFGKAGNYIFDGTTVKVKDARKQDRGVIYELEFYDREQNMEETMMDRKMVNFIKEQYSPGTRIRLNSMEDPYAPIAPGTEGEVDFVDDIGTIHMKWDNGRSLALIPGEDSFTVLPPKLTTLKLYMPLTADLYERNEYGDFDDSSTLLEGSELRGYQDQITAALVKNRMPEESVRGIMHWYNGFTCWVYKNYGMERCTSHAIGWVTLNQLVLEDIRRNAYEAKTAASEYMQMLVDVKTEKQKAEIDRCKRELKKADKRIEELTKILNKLYEDVALEKISQERYQAMAPKYEQEQSELRGQREKLSAEIARNDEIYDNIQQFLPLIWKYTNVQELTPHILNELIEKIVVHEKEIGEGGVKTQQVDIYYKFIGCVNIRRAKADHAEIIKAEQGQADHQPA